MKWIRKIMRLFSHKEEKPTPKLRKRAKSYAEMKKIRDELKYDFRRRGIG